MPAAVPIDMPSSDVKARVKINYYNKSKGLGKLSRLQGSVERQDSHRDLWSSQHLLNPLEPETSIPPEMNPQASDMPS